MAPGGPVQVLIVEDDPLARLTYRSLLEGMGPAVRRVGEAARADEAQEAVFTLKPDVVLLDLQLGASTGLQLARALIQRGYAGSILAVSVLPEDPYALQALEAGAAGYLRKDNAFLHLQEAILAVAGGTTYLHPSAAPRVLNRMVRSGLRPRPAHGTLTPRERETLDLLARGLSNKEIAARLHCSLRTTKAHVSQVLHKLGVEDRTQAALLAVRLGLVTSEIC